MFHKHNSSSDQDDENFDDHYKQIEYNGSGFDSDNNESNIDESESVEESRKVLKIKRKVPSSKELEHEEKSKAIKKNRISAKNSRLRKKEYQEVLELRASELEGEINHRRANIRNISQTILQKFRRTNKDKYLYLVQKMNLSQKLLAMSEDLQRLRATQEQNNRKPSEHQESRVEDSEALNTEELAVKYHKEEGTKSTRFKKKKGEAAVVNDKIISEAINEKEELMEMSVKAYMYEFGVKGCLRSDIIERSKFEWLQTLKKTTPHITEELCSKVANMKECMERLDRQTKLLDYHLRELKDRVKDKYVVQFLLDRQFFINNSADTIYKNSQLKTSTI